MNSVLLIKEFFDNVNYFTALTDANDNQYHRHEFVEIFYVVSGTAIQILNGKTQKLTAGNLFVLLPDDFHQFRAAGTESFVHRDLCIKKTEFRNLCNFLKAEYFDLIFQRQTELKIDIDIETIQHFEKCFKTFTNGDSPEKTDIACRTIATEILFLLFAEHFSPSKSLPGWISYLLDFMKTPRVMKMPISEVIDSIPYSKPYISAAFKKHIGVTMTQYFTDIKLNYAKYLLSSTSDSVSAIAESVGYNNLSFFYREFKKKYGVAPNQLRQKN